MAPDYENLILLRKIEVFEYALENTTGQDLYRVLWLKSLNSEHWLERRATYTRSLAVNSMVGYILGLGDRHPSNLMLERLRYWQDRAHRLRRLFRGGYMQPSNANLYWVTRWPYTAKSSLRRFRFH